MAQEGLQTVRDLISGFNTMQMHLGLTPLSGTATGFSQAPTFTENTRQPQSMHPGQAAQEAADRISKQTQRAVQDRSANLMYGKEFGERIAQVQANYMAPHVAQAYARSAGQQGFGGLPSPIFQTDPSMGIFRPSFAPPAAFATPPMQPQVTPLKLPIYARSLESLFQPAEMPEARFTNPYDRSVLAQQAKNQQYFAKNMARIPGAAADVASTATTMAGAALGAYTFGHLGGRSPVGTLVGTALGAVAGGIGGAMAGSAMSPMVQRLAEENISRPLVQRRAFGAQLQEMSRGFVTQGEELSTLGRGLSQRSSIQLGNRMMRDVEKGDTGGFNMRDMMKIGSQAADQGMLDMAQNGEQIASQMRNIARGLQSFMRIAQEPDVRRAMQQMGAMRAMGLTIPESNVAAQNAQTFAKMAGTTTSSLMQNAGMPGAMTFQRMGLTAGLGMQVGMGAAGLSRQAIAGGAFNPAQLALAGGASGLQQTLMESSGAALGSNFQTMALLSRNKEGQLSIDPERLKSVMSGHVTLSQQAQMASDNVQRLANQGGSSPEQVLTEFRTRINELRDEMGRRLGPMGGNMLLIRQALNLRKELGGNISLGGALGRVAPGLRTNQIRSLELFAQNANTWRGAQQQILNRVPEMRMAESRRRQAAIDEGGFSGALRKSWVGDAGRGISRAFSSLGDEYRQSQENVSEWWTDTFGGDERDDSGALVVRTPQQFQVTSARQNKALQRYMASDAYERGAAQNDRMFKSKKGPPSTDMSAWQTASTGYGVLRGAAQAATNAFGIGSGIVGGAMVSSLLPEASVANDTTVNKALRITGGFGTATGGDDNWLKMRSSLGWSGGAGGWFARNMGIMNNVGMSGDHMEFLRKHLVHRAQGVLELGQQLKEGERVTKSGRKELRKLLTENFAAASRGEGAEAGDDDYADFEENAVTATIDKLSTMTGWTGGQQATKDEIKKAIIEDAVKKGMPRERAQQRVERNWHMLGPIVMRRAHREGTKSTKSLTSKLLETSGFEGRGKSLKKAMREAKNVVSGAATLIAGTETSFFTGAKTAAVSGEAAEEYTNLAIETGDKEMLVRQAMALRARDEDGDREASNKILADLRKGYGKGGAEKVRKMQEEIGKEAPNSATLNATLAKAGAQSAGMSADDRVGRARIIRETASRLKIGIAVRKGAERQAEQEGRHVDDVLEDADPSTKEGKALREKLYAAGRVESSEMHLGGKGQGGAAEEGARNQANAIAQLASEIPAFKKASERLLEGADKLNSALSAGRLGRNHPKGQ